MGKQKKKKIVYRDDNEEQLRKFLIDQAKADAVVEEVLKTGEYKANPSHSAYRRAPARSVHGHVEPPLPRFNYAESVITTRRKHPPKGTPCTTKKGKSGKVTKTGDCYPSGRKSAKNVKRVGVSPTGHKWNGKKVYHTSRGAFFTYNGEKKIYFKRERALRLGFAHHIN